MLKTEIINNITIHSSDTPVKKYNLLRLYFIIPFTKDINLSEVTFLTELLNKETLHYSEDDLYFKMMGLNNLNLRFNSDVNDSNIILYINMKYCVLPFDDSSIFDKCLDLMSEFIFNPKIINGKFDEESFNEKRKHLLETYYIKQKSPDSILHTFFGNKLNNGAYKRFFSFNDKNLKKVTNESLVNLYNKFLNGKKSIVAVGNNNLDKIYNWVRINFKDNKDVKLRKLPVKYKSKEYQYFEKDLNKKDNKQALIAKLYTIELSKNTFNNLIACSFIGSYSDGLFKNVREKYGYCYRISGSFSKPYSTFLIRCSCDKNKVNETSNAIDEYMNDIIKNGISEENFEIVKKEKINKIKNTLDDFTNTFLYLNSYICKDKIRPLNRIVNSYKKTNYIEGNKALNTLKLVGCYVVK